MRFNFGIPRGLDGVPGLAGATGATVPAFTSFVVHSVTTLSRFVPASVLMTFDGKFCALRSTSRKDSPGRRGTTASTGCQALKVRKAHPGKSPPRSSPRRMIPTRSSLDIPISDPPTQSELQQVLAKVNELMVALRR